LADITFLHYYFCLVLGGRLSWLCRLLGARQYSASYRIVSLASETTEAAVIFLVTSGNINDHLEIRPGILLVDVDNALLTVQEQFPRPRQTNVCGF